MSALGGLSRGSFAVIGTTRVTLVLAALVAAFNLRRLANWAARTGIESDDPTLAAVTDDDYAFEELDLRATTGTDPPAAATPIHI